VKEGSRKGASVSVETLLGEPGWGLLFWGSGRIWGGELGMGITLLGGPAGEPGRGVVYQGLVKALEMGISLYRGPIENNGGVMEEGVCSPGTLRDS